MLIPVWQGIFVTISTISMFAYILIVVHIFKQRKQASFYNRSFFRLCLSNFIVHFAFFVEINTLFRPLQYGMLNFLFKAYPGELVMVVKIALCFLFYLGMVAKYGDFMVAANRLTSAFRPSTYEKTWAGVLWKLTAFQYFIPLFIVLTTVILQPLKPFTHVSSENRMMFRFDDGPLKHLVLIGAVTTVPLTTLSLLMYIVTIAKMRRLRSIRVFATKRKATNPQNDLETRCMASALLMFCGTIPHLIICAMLIAYQRFESITTIYAHLWMPAADVMISAPPWALILTSTKLRRHFWEKIAALLGTSPTVQ